MLVLHIPEQVIQEPSPRDPHILDPHILDTSLQDQSIRVLLPCPRHTHQLRLLEVRILRLDPQDTLPDIPRIPAPALPEPPTRAFLGKTEQNSIPSELFKS